MADASQFVSRVACGVICESNGRVLMVKENQDNKIVWNQPIGYLEPGESLVEAARRETFEETGISVEVINLVGVYTWILNPANTIIRFCFRAKALSDKLIPANDGEIISAEWLTYEELKRIENKFRNPLTKMCIDDYIKGKNYPLEVIDTIKNY